MEHLEDDENCWCNPTIEQECPESLGRETCDPNCWRCQGHPIVIIHHDPEGTK